MWGERGFRVVIQGREGVVGWRERGLIEGGERGGKSEREVRCG